jgi:ABC-type nitrate/sulfonate/bicarbonate transport system substrate-binding protein
MALTKNHLKIIAFPGAPNLPLFAAQERGLFEDAGIQVDIEATPSSIYQFEQFGTGGCDIAFTAFDNIVAYREGQGAATLSSVPDFRVLLGATQIELSIVVSPDIKQPSDLRGKTLALDAVSTGFAFVLYAMLQELGLPEGDYERVAVGATPERWQSVKAGVHAGTMTIEPFTSLARAAGFTVLSKSTDLFPAYQGGIIAARGDWAEANSDIVKNFVGAYLKGLEWTLSPNNRDAAAALLLKKMPDIRPGVVESVMTSLLSPSSGLTPQGAILPDGMRQVLALRSRYGQPKRDLGEIDKYLALQCYHEVLAALEEGTGRQNGIDVRENL